MSDLIPVEFQGQRILTTEQLAEIYQTEPRRITENLQRNQDHFIEGKHYHLLEGEALRTFLQYAQSVVQNPSKVRSLYLWTERGASRHCKILDTDKAWEQFDNLEETYFNPRRRKSLAQPNLKVLLTLVKIKREFFILSGIPKHFAYKKALESVERESGVDLPEFKQQTIISAKHGTLDLSKIIEAIKVVMSDDSNVYRHRGDEYALIKERVYSEFDARGLSRRGALAVLSDAGILIRTTSNHYAKAVRVTGRRPVRAIVVRLELGSEPSADSGY